ncbi:ATP synthase F1 subunit epsilon [Elioraea thermophila]|uniref:ATP synthase F1 subunit epsilon n=1 Tax=Elioraea thermophila TaxID=2185104 RepID=UPI000DF3E90A|nr:ATP synthase F1 subunit epsilon [Elioraea thermophila]
MANGLTLEIVSPEELLLSEKVDMAIIPAVEGDIGALPGHAPMIVSLRPGVVRAQVNGASAHEFVVVGGFAEIMPDRCTVVATEAVPAENATAEWIGERVRAAEAAYARTAMTAEVEAREDALRQTQLAALRRS